MISILILFDRWRQRVSDEKPTPTHSPKCRLVSGQQAETPDFSRAGEPGADRPRKQDPSAQNTGAAPRRPAVLGHSTAAQPVAQAEISTVFQLKIRCVCSTATTPEMTSLWVYLIRLPRSLIATFWLTPPSPRYVV